MATFLANIIVAVEADEYRGACDAIAEMMQLRKQTGDIVEWSYSEQAGDHTGPRPVPAPWDRFVDLNEQPLQKIFDACPEVKQ